MNNEYNNMNNGYNNMNNNPDMNGFNQQPMNNMGYNVPSNQPGYNPVPQNNYNNFNSFNTTGTTSSSNNKGLIAIICVVIVLVVGYVVYTNVSKGKDKITGTWSCTGSSTLKFDFNKDKTFKIHNQGINDSYIKGKYTKTKTTGPNSSYTYYKYVFVASETYSYGTKSTKTISQTYIVGVDSEGKNATITSTDGKENYTCTK